MGDISINHSYKSLCKGDISIDNPINYDSNPFITGGAPCRKTPMVPLPSAPVLLVPSHRFRRCKTFGFQGLLDQAATLRPGPRKNTKG